jgi:hypothetical protein
MNVRDAMQGIKPLSYRKKRQRLHTALLRVGFGSGIDFGSFVSAKSDSAVIV